MDLGLKGQSGLMGLCGVIIFSLLVKSIVAKILTISSCHVTSRMFFLMGEMELKWAESDNITLLWGRSLKTWHSFYIFFCSFNTVGVHL